jgi:Flp pilus assembly protein TadD
MQMPPRFIAIAVVLAFAVAGCETITGAPPALQLGDAATTPTAQNPGDVTSNDTPRAQAGDPATTPTAQNPGAVASNDAAYAQAGDPAAFAAQARWPHVVLARVRLSGIAQHPGAVKYFPSDESVHLAIEHFDRGNYGLAERYFREAVEKAPEDATAWVGLAASYDRLARFDLSDRAYKQVIRLTGETTQILNNLGYSFMLRGDLVRARQKFLRAYEVEPNNPTVLNNIHLLNSSYTYVQRQVEP